MKEHPTSRKKRDRQAGRYAWPIQVFFLAIGLSAALSLASQGPLSGAGILAAALILALFIALGILFDIIGVAVTAADPKPFHSMAAHKEKGAKEALMLLPVIMLSGMIFPIENMPEILQFVSCFIPARWYIDGLRKLMIEGLPFAEVMKEFLILLAMTAAIMAMSLKKFNDKLE